MFGGIWHMQGVVSWENIMLHADLWESPKLQRKKIMSFSDQWHRHKSVRFFRRVSHKYTILQRNTQPCILICEEVLTSFLIFSGIWYLLLHGRSQKFWRSYCWTSEVHGDRHQLLGFKGLCLRNTFFPLSVCPSRRFSQCFCTPFEPLCGLSEESLQHTHTHTHK